LKFWTTLFTVTLGCILCGQTRAEEAGSARAKLHVQFAAQLKWLADKCDAIGLKREARVTRNWLTPRLKGRQTFALPGARFNPPPASAPANVKFWHEKFVEFRAAYADSLFALAQQQLKAGDAASAYQLLHETARQNPDHSVARRVLAGASAAGARIRTSRGRTPFRLCGWNAGQYSKVTSPHFEIFTNHTPPEAIAAARYLEQVYDIWRQMFFLHWSTPAALRNAIDRRTPLQTPGRQHKVVLFESRADYIRTLSRENPGIDVSKGYYAYDSGYSLFYAGDQGAHATWAHEATHQLFQETGIAVKDAGAARNFWMLEAVALYMESLQLHNGYATTGGFDASRMQLARFNALYGVFNLPLAELSALGRDQLNTDPRIRNLYTQSAGVAHFLFDGESGGYRRKTIDFLRLMYQGRDTATALPQLLGVKFATLDTQYKAFLNVSGDDLLHRAAPSPSTTALLLPHTTVTGASLAGLTKFGHLEWLNLGRTGIATAAPLAACPRLKRLDLDGTRIGPGALNDIVKLKQLESLDLSGTAIDDASLQHLAALPRLEELYLTSTKITDAGLLHLHKIKTLKVVDLDGTAVTPAGMAALRKAVPALQK